MINLEKHPRFNYLSINKETVLVEEKICSPSLITDALENLGLEYVDSKFTTDFDFFIANTRTELKKNRYYGKPVYLIDTVIKSLLSGRQQALQSQTFHNDYLPMLRSKDRPTAVLGYDLIIKCFSYLDWAHISFLVEGKIYPYYNLFYLPDYYTRSTAYVNSKHLWAFFGTHYISNRLKMPDIFNSIR